MNVPNNLKYTKDHEWLRIDGNEAVVGITHHAQDQLGDVVFVELPAVGDSLSAGQTFGTVESVKAVSDLFAPATGEVTAVNDALTSGPDVVNSDPYGAGWMIKITLSGDAEGLLSPDEYRAHLENS